MSEFRCACGEDHTQRVRQPCEPSAEISAIRHPPTVPSPLGPAPVPPPYPTVVGMAPSTAYPYGYGKPTATQLDRVGWAYRLTRGFFMVRQEGAGIPWNE